MIFPLVQGREHDWPLWAFALIAASVAVFGFFGWYEGRAAAAAATRWSSPACSPSAASAAAWSSACCSSPR
ncbi:hypothetical protein ACFQ1I_06805 [Kitasatospora arboriphila]